MAAPAPGSPRFDGQHRLADKRHARPPANNGGPTPALALLAGSPAIDKGDSNHSGAPHQDQRGFTRLVICRSTPMPRAQPLTLALTSFSFPESYRDIGFHAFDGTRANKIAAQRPAVSALQTRPIAAVVLRRSPDARAARPTRAQRCLCRLINGPGRYTLGVKMPVAIIGIQADDTGEIF